MEPRFEDLTKEQLIAELNVATEKLKYYREIEDHARAGIQLSPQELSARLAIAEARLAVFEEEKRREEKKRELERRLGEATDLLKSNGYEVVPATEIKRMQSKIKLDAETMRGAFLMTKGERIWRDDDMKAFAHLSFFKSPEYIPQLLEDYANSKLKS